MTDAEQIAQLRQALDLAQRRLQSVVDVSGALLGTLEFELRADDELVFVREDEVARRLIALPLSALRGRRLAEALPDLVTSGLPDALCDTARNGVAMPVRPAVMTATDGGHLFSLFAFQAAPQRVVLKFWPSDPPLPSDDGVRHSQALLSQVIQNSPVAVALTRACDGTIVDVNAEWSRLTGHAHHEALGRTTVQLGFWADASDRVRALGPLEDRGIVRNPEGAMRTRDGRRVITAMHGSNVEIGGERHILVYVLDMTARAQAESALRQLNAELETRVAQRTAELARARDEAERASRVKSEFLSSMSHELRTPLNAILGFGQLLQLAEATVLPPREQGFVREILRAGSHLLELINEVLDLARIEAGKLPISLEPVHLATLVDEGLALMRPVALERRIQLLPLEMAAPDLHVRADRTRTRQVLLNLLSNAIKYNRDGGTVRVRCTPDGDAVRIEVIDTGQGLTEAQQRRLFQDFERLDADRSGQQGTGIGLALSLRLVQLMQGTIGVNSQPGQGSTFWVRLQAATPVPMTRAADGLPSPRPAGTSTTDGPVVAHPSPHPVLYIEDNPVNVVLMEQVLLGRPRIQLVHAPLPVLGLEIAHTLRPALILLDIQLPGMDGFEVLRRLRQDEATRAIPVVAVSANAMPADLRRATAAGFAHYLTKPLDLAQLLAVMDQCLPP